MNQIEAKNFLDTVLNQIWPDWEPTPWELEIWTETIQLCDYDRTRARVRYWFMDSTRPGKKPILGIFRRIMVVDKASLESNEPVLLYALSPLDKLSRRDKFYCSKPPMPDAKSIEFAAERDRVRAEDYYGGDWVVIRMWEQETKPVNDDPPLTAKGRKDVERKILEGPDCPGRKFLQKHRGLELANVGALLTNINEAVGINEGDQRTKLHKQVERMREPGEDPIEE